MHKKKRLHFKIALNYDGAENKFKHKDAVKRFRTTQSGKIQQAALLNKNI